MFQNPDNQFVGTTVADDVAFGLENHQIPHDQMQARIDESLKAVGMQDFADSEPAMLSGGQKQRVALARILAIGPRVIILDEATSMLDPKGRHDLLKLLKKLIAECDMTVFQSRMTQWSFLLSDYSGLGSWQGRNAGRNNDFYCKIRLNWLICIWHFAVCSTTAAAVEKTGDQCASTIFRFRTDGGVAMSAIEFLNVDYIYQPIRQWLPGQSRIFLKA